ncbi:MAG: ribonuclease H-like domain-containing protein [Lachnospiraceae bacterium]|nr:ribonuclease H-like domain-containing protein [Lachnospiraceae bacterium]
MKYICRPLSQDAALSALFPDADPGTFFLDIETTGLRADESYLYLIGAASCEAGPDGTTQWMYHAWFGHEMLDEQKILREFLRYAGEHDTCITFSGNRFDITYLNRCLQEYYMDRSVFERLDMNDYLTLLRPLQNLLSVSRSRLGTWEERTGREREDRGCFLSGAEMSAMYQNAPRPFPEPVMEALLLHNRCDLQSLVLLKRLLAFSSLAERPLNFTAEKSENGMTLTAGLDASVPLPVSRFSADYECTITGRSLTITVYESTQDCRLYFPDYRNYYVVAGESGVIHKDLATLLPKEMCKKATPETCYQTVSGRFLPMPLPAAGSHLTSPGGEASLTVLKRSYDATCGYVRAEDAYSDLSAYGREFLRGILQSAE